MALQKITRRSVPDAVFEQLLAELLGGGLLPGAAIPSERRLAEVLGVSRPAVREALQRLAAAGLVEVRQGEMTTVRDFRRTGGLDLLPRLLVVGGELDLSVARSILEARLLVGPKAVELAAERTGAALRQPLQEVLAAMAATDDPVERQRRALDFWSLVVDGADSIAFRLMFNSLVAAYEPALEALAVVMAVEVERTDDYAAIIEAVAAGDGPTARHRAEELLGHLTESFIALIDQLEEN